MQALRAIIHENFTVKEAWEMFNTARQEISRR
jgi:hypothetical protein